MKAIVIGSGGHAKVIIDILRFNREIELVGCITADKDCDRVLDLAVLGDDARLPMLYEEGIRHAFVAIGDNRLRAKIAGGLEAMGFTLINAIHPFSAVASSVKLGKGVAIMAGAVINPDSVVGDYAIINTGVTVDHDCIIGKACHLAPGTHTAGNVSVGEGTFLGVGCNVIPKMTIGEWCVLGAGTTVVKELPSCVLAVGVPAKVLKKM